MNEPNALTPLQQAAIARKLLEAEVVSRAWSDETFRAKLESQPGVALAEAGTPAPDGMSVQVVFEEPGTIHLVLPPKPAAGGAEASDEELEAVAGGGIIENGKCSSWDNVTNQRNAGKIGDFDEFVLKAFGSLSAIWGVSWGYW
jgi:hypothetical protein